MLTENDLKVIAQIGYKAALRKFQDLVSNRKIAKRSDMQSYLNIVMIINRN